MLPTTNLDIVRRMRDDLSKGIPEAVRAYARTEYNGGASAFLAELARTRGSPYAAAPVPRPGKRRGTDGAVPKEPHDGSAGRGFLRAVRALFRRATA